MILSTFHPVFATEFSSSLEDMLLKTKSNENADSYPARYISILSISMELVMFKLDTKINYPNRHTITHEVNQYFLPKRKPEGKYRRPADKTSNLHIFLKNHVFEVYAESGPYTSSVKILS